VDVKEEGAIVAPCPKAERIYTGKGNASWLQDAPMSRRTDLDDKYDVVGYNFYSNCRGWAESVWTHMHYICLLVLFAALIKLQPVMVILVPILAISYYRYLTETSPRPPQSMFDVVQDVRRRCEREGVHEELYAYVALKFIGSERTMNDYRNASSIAQSWLADKPFTELEKLQQVAGLMGLLGGLTEVEFAILNGRTPRATWRQRWFSWLPTT